MQSLIYAIGYATFFANVGEYDLNGAPFSWTKVVAMRHALTKFPDATYFFCLDEDAFIMNPSFTIEGDIMKSSKIEEKPAPAPAVASANPAEASAQRDAQHLKPLNPEAEDESKQPLINLPKNPLDSSAVHGQASEAVKDATVVKPVSSAPQVEKKAPQSDAQKVIFATGGITNGEQCLQILNAGASVCQVYTAMMYGGVGTMTRIKSEMREEMKKSKRS